MPPQLDPEIYTVAAALHMMDCLHPDRFPMGRGDDYVFRAGECGGHNTVIATLPAGQEYGTGSAAALASQVKKFFPNLWFGLLVGVAAGLPNLTRDPPRDIRLGDVLVALPDGESAGLVAYDLGKETAESGFQLLRHGQVLATTETVIRSAIGNIKLDAPDDATYCLEFYETIKTKEHGAPTFDDPGQEHDKLYTTGEDGGEKLDARKRDQLRDAYDLIGLEMEAAGTMNRIPVGVIRGVCDYGDLHKNKRWQPYAAAMAAAYAKVVLGAIPPKASSASIPTAPSPVASPPHAVFHGPITGKKVIAGTSIQGTNTINFY
ncbi:hypothetical protein M0657_010955 [Pyricularia oryzae]|nr:hypothetical protein M0657_010955 [Pyricularia oryzae]KAI7911911.1 hypothetical protein M9X92_010306 [Pyricularia oryzae]